MIIVSKTGRGGLDIKVDTRQPTIYLDQWALVRFSENTDRQNRLINAFKDKGTLLISWTNVFDLSGPQGASAEKIRRFFERIGEHWFPIEWNPFKVIEREPKSGTDSPCFSRSFLEKYYPHIHKGPFVLSTLFDLISYDGGKTAKQELARLKKEAGDFVHELKSCHTADPTWLDRTHPLMMFDPARPAASVFTQLMRVIVNERGFAFTPNDGVDLFHATVPAAYGDFVLLDKSWIRRLRTLAFPPGRLRAYYEAELDHFLMDFERTVVQARTLR